MAKKTSSSQKLLPRKPRVQIEYDVEVGDAIRQVELPWITGVMSDLSGSNAEQLPDVADRKFSEVDAENFNSFMKDQKPGLTFSTENLLSGSGKLGVDVTLESMDDFNPDDFARKVGAEIIEIAIEETGKGAERKYVFDADNADSVKFGESADTLDVLTREYVAYKMGEAPSDIEVTVQRNTPKAKHHILRIVKKGPLAKLLDARTRLKELLIKVDGKASAQKALEEILADKDAVEQSLQDGATNQSAE